MNKIKITFTQGFCCACSKKAAASKVFSRRNKIQQYTPQIKKAAIQTTVTTVVML